MDKKLELISGKTRTFLGKINNIVFSSGVYYNAYKACVSKYLLYNMRSAIMGSFVQVKYIK